MKKQVILTLAALALTVGAQAKKGGGNHAGEHANGHELNHNAANLNCTVKVNKSIVLSGFVAKGAVLTFEDTSYLAQGTVSAAGAVNMSLTLKSSGEVGTLVGQAAGDVNGTLLSDAKATPVEFVLAANQVKAQAFSADGDKMQLERGFEHAQPELEIAIISNSNPTQKVKFSCGLPQ